MARERTYLVHPFDDVYDDFRNGPWNLQLITQIASYLPGQHAVSTEQLRKLSNSPVVLRLSLSQDLIANFCEDTKIELSMLRLSIRTYSRFMNLSQVVYSVKLSEIEDLAEELSIGLNGDDTDATNPIFACHTGFEVQVLVTLDQDRDVPKNELKPRHRFTILATESFRLRPATGGGLGLQFLKLTPEIRRAENIPNKSSYFIKKIEKPWTVQKITDCAVVFVDSLLLEKAHLLRSKAQGQRQFLEIHVEILDAMLQDFSAHIQTKRALGQSVPTYESVQAMVAGKIIRILYEKGNGTGGQLSHDQLIAELADNPSRSKARAQAALLHLDAVLEVFDEEENQ